MSDLISRQAAIDAVSRGCQEFRGIFAECEKNLNALPAVQTCDDAVSRQAAIDALMKRDKELRNINWYDKPFAEGECKGIDYALEIVNALPSAQPEPCVDTIDALDESIKHFDDMAEECRRNANIEQNDYMDMRDDATEYRQLSIWLNELKWLRERFQSQPDLSEYSDKLWKAAYERGKAEAQQRWIPCSKRLPEVGTYVLVSKKSLGFRSNLPNVCTAHRSRDPRSGKEEWIDMLFGKLDDDDVLAWMPLPESYKEE